MGVEAAGEGVSTGHHSATLTAGRPGVLHGSMSYLLQDADGQVLPGALHFGRSRLSRRRCPDTAGCATPAGCTIEAVGDREALDAFQLFARLEGIIPALETAHAIAWIHRARARWGADDIVLLNLSGRGDKDVAYVATMTAAAAPGTTA